MSIAERATIEGTAAPEFAAVREAFTANFTDRGDQGAAVCVYRHGIPVVDLWGGSADPPSDRLYAGDTLQLVFSTTKGATAVCANLLIERGLLDPSAPVAEYWPEFAAAGKGGITVEWLLTHQSGLPAIDATLTMSEALAWDPIVEALADQKPLWEPGTAHGYHALTFGWLVGEVVRRVSGMTIGSFFAREVADPLDLEFWIGLPPSEEHRVAPLTITLDYIADMDPEQLASMATTFGPDGLGTRALFLNGTFGDFGEGGGPFNLPELHAAEVPAANGITTARSLARFYAGLIGEVDGVRVLQPETVADMSRSRTVGTDLVLGGESKFGLGVMCDSPFTPLLGPGGFGHFGAGGSVGFAHPESGITFGYVMNQMRLSVAGDDRTTYLIDAVRQSIG
ncbi:MAG TPA: serine hydrolase domain-containing protein [Acidimicrobiales bacterium]|nr:serine hydrolase domain-containing protein [Acidimicrobiales bacterium]